MGFNVPVANVDRVYIDQPSKELVHDEFGVKLVEINLVDVLVEVVLVVLHHNIQVLFLALPDDLLPRVVGSDHVHDIVILKHV